MPSSRSPTPEPSSSSIEATLHTYHCLCSTHLLTTPYAISSLPQRRDPSIDQARILPLPAFSPHASEVEDDAQGQHGSNPALPSLLSPNLKAARKPSVVQREDGWEKRRMWKCGRCGVGIGYEILRDEDSNDGRKGDGVTVDKVLFLLDGGLVETGKWEG